MNPSGDALVHALRGALPWLKLYRGATFVVKLGGAALDEDQDISGLVDQLALLHALGMRVVVVHGGGAQISRTQQALGVEVRKVDGRRVTDARTLEVAAMVLNGSVMTALFVAPEHGARALRTAGPGVLRRGLRRGHLPRRRHRLRRRQRPRLPQRGVRGLTFAQRVVVL